MLFTSVTYRDKNAIPSSLAKAVLPRPAIPSSDQCYNPNNGPVCPLLHILSNIAQDHSILFLGIKSCNLQCYINEI